MEEAASFQDSADPGDRNGDVMDPVGFECGSELRNAGRRNLAGA